MSVLDLRRKPAFLSVLSLEKPLPKCFVETTLQDQSQVMLLIHSQSVGIGENFRNLAKFPQFTDQENEAHKGPSLFQGHTAGE